MRSTHKTEAEAVQDFLINSEEFKKLQALAKQEKPVIDYVNVHDEAVLEARSYPQKKLVEQLEQTRKFSTIIEGTESRSGTSASFFNRMFRVESFVDTKSNFFQQLTHMRQKAKEFSSQQTFAAEPTKVKLK